MNTLYNCTAEMALADQSLNGLVRLAYLDPPYNTGRKFSTYSDSSPLEDWLGMMRRTLTGVRASLRADGSVWVHLDDRYVHRIRIIMDEIFGAGNYVGTVIWEKKNRPSYLHAHLADVTDHILVYAKDKKALAPFVNSSTEVGKRIPIHNKNNPPAEISFPAGSVAFNFPDGVIPAAQMNTPTITSALLNDLVVEGGINANAFRMTGPFRWSQDAVNKLADNGGEPAFICPRPMLRPSYLSQEAKGKVLTNLQSFRVNGSVTNEDARAESEAIFGTGAAAVFDTPKPEGLLQRIISAASDPGDIVLDPFAGSGTTLAVAQKLNRSWIGVELFAETIDTFIRPRLDGILAGTDPLPIAGAAPSATGYTLHISEKAA